MRLVSVLEPSYLTCRYHRRKQEVSGLILSYLAILGLPEQLPQPRKPAHLRTPSKWSEVISKQNISPWGGRCDGFKDGRGQREQKNVSRPSKTSLHKYMYPRALWLFDIIPKQCPRVSGWCFIFHKCLPFPALFRSNWTGQFACGQGNGCSSSGGDW